MGGNNSFHDLENIYQLTAAGEVLAAEEAAPAEVLLPPFLLLHQSELSIAI